MCICDDTFRSVLYKVLFNSCFIFTAIHLPSEPTCIKGHDIHKGFSEDNFLGRHLGQLGGLWKIDSEISVWLSCSHPWVPPRRDSRDPSPVLLYCLENRLSISVSCCLISSGSFTLFPDKIQADPSSICTNRLICIDFSILSSHRVPLLSSITKT